MSLKYEPASEPLHNFSLSRPFNRNPEAPCPKGPTLNPDPKTRNQKSDTFTFTHTRSCTNPETRKPHSQNAETFD